MNNLKGRVTGLALVMYSITSAPMIVQASASTSDAVSDIMNNSRFTGAIESIKFLTGLVDYWFTMVITLTAFFIISSALLKNACAGAYVANHKFWDKVAEAHEKTDALNMAGMIDYFKGRQFMQTSAGGVRDFLLGFVPNIKALTDFDDADIEPKQYWTKAIPQMLGCIIIGVFIYNGFYRDAASTVGNFGSEICNRIFTSIDPSSFLDKISQTTSTPDNIYANDQSQQGKDCYAISMELYKSYLSISTDLTDFETKTSLMRDCEDIAKNIITSSTFFQSTCYSETRAYDFTLTNLKATPCATPSKSLNAVHTELADKDTKSKYTCNVYVVAPNTAKSLIKANQQACYITFVMSGSQKKSTSVGLSHIESAPGSWNSQAMEVQSMSVKYNDPSKTKNGKIENKGGGITLTSTVLANRLVTESTINSWAASYCQKNNLKYVQNSAKVSSYDSWNSGTNTNPQLSFNKVAPNSSRTFYVNIIITIQDESSGDPVQGEQRIRVPVKVILTQ